MTTDTFQRKLTAILSADVVGYSRLMGDDEEATVRTLSKYKEMIFGHIKRHNGRLVDSPGDNLLAEFTSVVDAIRCAVQIQEDLKVSNEELPIKRKMQFRIGINIGDVIQDGDRIYGDGVNVAARIESLADAGGICISHTAYDQVKKKLNNEYEYLGEYAVKNIDEPVRVYRIRMEPEAESVIKKEKKAGLRRWQWAALSVVAILIIGAVANWYFSFRQAPVVEDVEEAPKTIAVLPFDDLSPEKDQEYFVLGLSEEILNSLAQINDLTVIAKTSSFSFRGTNKTIQEIADVLGVENILEGSVRKAGNALRITAQLIKAVDGSHLWSKTYDKEFIVEELFSVQEDIAKAVADELKATFGIDKFLRPLGSTDNAEAYEHYLVAKGIRDKTTTEGTTGENFLRAFDLVDAAIALDPKFALPWVLKSDLNHIASVLSPANQASDFIDAALSSAQRSIELEPDLAAGSYQLGFIKSTTKDFVGAEVAFRHALDLEAGRLSNFRVGTFYCTVGNFEKAKEILEEILRNDPLNPNARMFYMMNLALLGNTAGAEREYEHGKELFGDRWQGVNTIVTIRLGAGVPLSKDDIPLYSADSIIAISNKVREHLESPNEGLEELRRFFADETKLTSKNLGYIACWAAYFGDPEFAIEILEKTPNSVGFENIWYPVMKEARQLPRFKEFVKEIGLVDYWNEFGWPDICRPLDNGDFECD